MTLNRSLGVLMLPPVLAACAILESSSGPAITVTAISVPVDLALGDTARITITVRNSGDRAVELRAPGCNTDFFISDDDGNAYTPAESVYCTLELKAPIYLSAGQVHQIHAFTTGRVVPQGSQAVPSMLLPGDYLVRPVVHVFAGDEEAVLVSASPLLVTFR
jgi:hypothetical protein